MKNKNLIFAAISLVIFVLIAVLYANPIISGKEMIQPDIVHYKGGAKELLDYRAEHGKETYWSDAMFGGMPTYQTGVQFRGDIIKKLDDVFMFLPKPANYIFLLFAGFFFLGIVATRNWKYALLGATFFGLSTYFYIIIAAGHNGKVHTIAYFAPLLAGILLVYVRKKYILGFIVTTIFMALQVSSNHPQMTYYLFLALGFLFLSELVRAYKKKITWKHFGISSGILALAFALGVGMNAQRIMANAEYVKETVRGKQILDSDRHTSGKSGMDRASITAWSYGKLETLNLFIPRLMGGASQEPGSDKMMAYIQEWAQSNITSQTQYDQFMKGFVSPSYWGEQPGTSGPAYQGAVVCFLALLGFFFAWKKYRYWILGATILTILLAWGSNFAFLTDLFIDFVPMYNKFRAPSSILVVVELLFPFIAIIGLYRFFTDEKQENDYKQKVLLYTTGSVVGITLLLMLAGKAILGFHTDNEKIYLQPDLLNYLVDERFKMFQTDAFKAIIFVLITAGAMFLSFKKKLSVNIALVIIGLVSFFDLWTVNKRYLNDDNFVDKTFAQNPYQTENSEYLMDKAGDNQYIQGLLQQDKVNKVLETIAEKDQSHYRIFNSTLGTFSETNTSYFKSSVGGYHAVKLRRYDDLINAYFYQTDSIRTPRILNMLNAKYFVGGDMQQPISYPNPEANGNAWFVSQVKVANSPNEELKSIGELDTKKIAIVGKEDQDYLNGKTLQADSTAFIQLKSYQANAIEFEAETQTPQLAVFSEIYYPHGWKVSIDGTEVPYIKANYLLRAVHVPAGKHNISMKFEPEVIETGKIYSYASVGIFAILSLLSLAWYYKNKKSKAVDA
ncbi:YfhO family protein [Chryseobacterium sp. POL2]|uniref:YfhO family protein n=1 Tax=Chryseobacterium sp. POL2 TaxID=2713414 RepID=UPI0013E10D98|nr:YfhO family protein [Chryseobacterium sp. POL2]QIG90704.1 YfhO family protein [Chryseobacterium sp. POL2]